MGMLGSQSNDKKPLFRSWAKQNPDSKAPVVSIRLSSSEEWILIECEECVALLNAESKVGQSFWSTVQKFKGKASGLQVYSAKGKIGFDLEPSDIKGFWSWDGENQVDFDTKESKSTAPMMSSDLWEKMIDDSWRKETENKTTKPRGGKNPSKVTATLTERSQVDEAIVGELEAS